MQHKRVILAVANPAFIMRILLRQSLAEESMSYFSGPVWAYNKKQLSDVHK
jgi:hypothetical protein